MDPAAIGCSDFLLKTRPMTEEQQKELFEILAHNWVGRVAGQGEKDTTRKVVVPLPPEKFPCRQLKLEGENLEIIKNNPAILKSKVSRRQKHEDSFVSSYINISDVERLGLKLEESRFAYAVCYSKDALLENGGTRSTECEWEVVAIISSEIEPEPMMPLTMARNELVKPGGTKSEYSAEQYAQATYYWSQRVSVRADDPEEPFWTMIGCPGYEEILSEVERIYKKAVEAVEAASNSESLEKARQGFVLQCEALEGLRDSILAKVKNPYNEILDSLRWKP